MKFQNENKKLKIEIDTSKLSPSQVRLVRSINSMLKHVALSEDESQYFDGSAELMRMVASFVQLAKYSTLNNSSAIPYGDQAIEFSMELVSEALEKRKVISWDN